MGILKITKKDLKKQKKAMLATAEDVKIPIDDNYVYENEYYLGISRFFRLFEYILIICTLLFAVGCVMSHPEIMSYNNFLTFVKDFNMSTVDAKHYTELIYDTDNTDGISLYKSGAVVPGSDSIFVFTATGRLAYTDTHSFSEPRLETGSSVSLLYDFSSSSYSIYNSYTRVYKGESEHPIYFCALSDSGRYAFIVKKNDGKFGVSVYSQDNVRICSFESDKYIISASLDSPGERIAISSFGVASGERYAELKIYDCGTGEMLLQKKIEHAQPIRCGFFDDGGAFVITDKKTVFFDPSLAECAVKNAEDISSVHADGRSIIINSKNNITVFDSDGDILIEKAFAERVVSFTSFEDTLFVLCSEKVYKIGLTSGAEEKIQIEKDYRRILATSDKHVILCGVSRASLVDFD